MLKPTTIKDIIFHLMSRHIPGRIKLKPEEQVCFALADKMRELTCTGIYNGVWFNVCNEGNRGRISNLILMALGMIRGTPDYAFIGTWGAGLLEVKAPPRQRVNKKTGKLEKVQAGKQSEEQVYFQKWCEFNKINYAVCYDVDGAIAILNKWGALA